MDFSHSCHKTGSRAAVWILLLLIVSPNLAACGSADAAPTPSLAPTVTATTTPLGVGQGTAVPTVNSTPANTLTLVLWWPEALAPTDSPAVGDLLNQQFVAFNAAEATVVDIQFRLKRYEDVGGIMSTLRTASAVAPGVLPDLTLIRREDLVAAVQSGLVYPLEGWVASSIIGDLYDSALALGQVDGQIYGLPYTLDALHLAYRRSGGNPTVWTFADTLERQEPLVFPARSSGGVNNTFFLQYLSAGGTLPRADGTLQLNEEALRATLTFYEQAYTEGIINAQVFEYGAAADYLSALTLGEINIAVVDSSTYLDLRQEERDWQAAAIPTESGQPISLVNGWMWVLTTNDVNRQALAARFLNWMMNPGNQREFAATIHMLPSQRSALQAMEAEAVDVELMDAILLNAIIPLPENTGGTLARAMQDALYAVLSGQTTADEATQSVVDQAP